MTEKQREKVRKCDTIDCPNRGRNEQPNGDVLCPACEATSRLLKYALERETR